MKETAASVDNTSEGERSQSRELERRLADCSGLVYRVAMGVLRNSADAEDVAQEALLRAFRHFASLRERDRFQPWLVRTTWRLAIDRLRSSSRRGRREFEAVASDPPAPTVERIVIDQQFQRRVEMAVDALPEKFRRVVILAALEGYDMRETADLLDLPEGTVRSRLNRARKLLAERLR